MISYRYLALPGRRGMDEGRLLRPKETRRMITVSDHGPEGSTCRAVVVLRPFGSRAIDPRENCTLRKPDIFQDVIVQSGKARNGRAACPSGPEGEECRSQSCGQRLVRAVRKSKGQGRHSVLHRWEPFQSAALPNLHRPCFGRFSGALDRCFVFTSVPAKIAKRRNS